MTISRTRDKRIVAGVCDALGRYFGIEPMILRVIWIAVTIFSIPIGLVSYVLLWLVLPKDRPLHEEAIQIMRERPIYRDVAPLYRKVESAAERIADRTENLIDNTMYTTYKTVDRTAHKVKDSAVEIVDAAKDVTDSATQFSNPRRTRYNFR